jgi:haloalkane dehalogenase
MPVTIRYVDTGLAQKRTVLLMDGVPTWGYRVIAPDFLGHGWSDRRDCFDRSFQDQPLTIIGLLDNLELPVVDAVGHDTEGAVALIFAIEQQARSTSGAAIQLRTFNLQYLKAA